jgi:hypothetical protein
MTTIRHSWYPTSPYNFDQIEYFTGSSFTGASGAVNRIVTLSNTRTTSGEQVFVDGLRLHSSLFTVTRATMGSTVTVSSQIWNDQLVVVQYWHTS